MGLLGSAPGSAGCRGQVPKSTRGRRRQSFPGPQASPLSFPLLISPPRSGGEQGKALLKVQPSHSSPGGRGPQEMGGGSRW